MDDKITAAMQEWLAKDAPDRDIEQGASLLLSLNRNRILYNHIVRRPAKMAAKLEYELKKHLRIRLDGLTVRDVALMERKVLPAADLTLKKHTAQYVGKRKDHDSLPDDIRALWDRNGDVWNKLKKTRETLRQMESLEPCDRYELCKILSELDTEYHRNLTLYDSYKGGDTLAPSQSKKSTQSKKSNQSKETNQSNQSKETVKSKKAQKETQA